MRRDGWDSGTQMTNQIWREACLRRVAEGSDFYILLLKSEFLCIYTLVRVSIDDSHRSAQLIAPMAPWWRVFFTLTDTGYLANDFFSNGIGVRARDDAWVIDREWRRD